MSWLSWLTWIFASYGVLTILGAVMGMMYFFLPFALFGIKRQLRQLIAEQEKTNALLRTLTPPVITSL